MNHTRFEEFEKDCATTKRRAADASSSVDDLRKEGAGPPPAVATSRTLPRGPSAARTKTPRGRQEVIDIMRLELTSSSEYRNATSAMTGYARDQRAVIRGRLNQCVLKKQRGK